MRVPERYRVNTGPMASDVSYGNNGAFLIPLVEGTKTHVAQIIAGEGLGWQHVSIRLPNEVPSWAVMCLVKELFWEPEDCVVQYHPPASDYVNNHPFVLHLWRQIGAEYPRPPIELVGTRSPQSHLIPAEEV
jgi:hypothetical protein